MMRHPRVGVTISISVHAVAVLKYRKIKNRRAEYPIGIISFIFPKYLRQDIPSRSFLRHPRGTHSLHDVRSLSVPILVCPPHLTNA